MDFFLILDEEVLLGLAKLKTLILLFHIINHNLNFLGVLGANFGFLRAEKVMGFLEVL